MSIKHAIHWFEIPVNDYERAISFYEKVFDIKLQKEKMNDIDFALFPATESSIAGALIKSRFQKPSEQGCLVYLNVDGMMDEVIDRATQQGSNVFLVKMHLGECGYIAHISDSEGNKIALHSIQK